MWNLRRRSARKSVKKMEFNPAKDIDEMIDLLVNKLEFEHLQRAHIYSVRSNHSGARAYARIWGLSRIFQIAAGYKPTYVIEVLSEHFDKLSYEEKIKVLIHELLHIPKTFSGALRGHKGRYHRINDTEVSKLFKKIGFSVVPLFGVLTATIIGLMAFFGSPARVNGQEQYTGERIDDYTVAIEIKKSGELEINENINYNFDTLQRHGIFRNIPYIYTSDAPMDGSSPSGAPTKWKMDLDLFSVTGENGALWKYSQSTEGDNYTIKIGDANKYVTGRQVYDIRYTVKGGILYFSDHDELYWNAIGGDWAVPIAHAQAKITLPEPKNAQYKFRCFVGVTGSNSETDCEIRTLPESVVFTALRPLQPGENLTIVVSMAKGVVAELLPEKVIPFFDTWFGKITLFLLTILVIFWYVVYPLWIIIKWFREGRDPELGKGYPAFYDPPRNSQGRQLSPAETGSLIDEVVHVRDIFAGVIDLARRGYLRINEESKGNTILEKTDPKSSEDLLPFEKKIYSVLFKSGEIVSLKSTNISSEIYKIQQDIYSTLVSDGFFYKNPNSVRNFYIGMLVLGFITLNLPLVFVSATFGRAMPRKTMLGAQEKLKALGLLRFIKSQERHFDYIKNKKADFQLSSQFLFEKFLPFAVAFGVEKQWFEKFKDITLEQPTWYSTYRTGGFNSVMMSSMNSSVSAFTSSSTVSSTGHSSGFSGGGSSGGGGGGGGGGSW